MQTWRRLCLFVFTLLGFSFIANAQTQQIASVVHAQHKFNSAVLGEERTVLVRTPPNYERNSQKYPVVVMLDAHPPYNSMMPGIIEQLSWSGKMPEMILVGIPNVNRNRDLTPTKTERPGSGGTDKFLDFVETEVLPLIDKNYRTQPYRVFAGHSLGGLTVVYTMIARPKLFNSYIAASPVLHWDKNFVINKTTETFKAKRDWGKTLFIALGDEPNYIAGFNSYKELLKKSAPEDLEYEFQHWTDEDHGSIVLRAYYAGLRKVFSGWQPPAQTATVADLQSHYAKLTKRFGYEIKPPENLVNQLGYTFLQANKTSEAIEAFEKNTQLYPDSPNVYDSLAEAYEKSGAKSKALANYEKAYKMAEKSGEEQLARSAKANYDRLNGN